MAENKITTSTKRAPAPLEVEELIRNRWSPRAFSSENVTDEQLSTLFAAASWAASSYNEQPWRFIVGRRGDEVYQHLLDSMIPFNCSWAESAPLLYLGVARNHFSTDEKINRFALHDLGAAGATLALQATAMGLHTHSMAGFDTEKLRPLLNIPDEYLIGPITALGRQGDLEVLPEKLRAGEAAPRSRRPLENFVFGSWGTPLILS